MMPARCMYAPHATAIKQEHNHGMFFSMGKDSAVVCVCTCFCICFAFSKKKKKKKKKKKATLNA